MDFLMKLLILLSGEGQEDDLGNFVKACPYHE
jgi:hypothetical protein